jgi:hypothetical protein
MFMKKFLISLETPGEFLSPVIPALHGLFLTNGVRR